MSKQTSKTGWLVAIALVLVIVVAGIIYFARQADPSHQSPVASSTSSGSESVGKDDNQIAHPIEQADVAPASSSAAPLPALNSSDDHVISSLDALLGNSDLSTLLLQPQVVQRIVATVDALPRRGLNRVMMPMRSPKGSFDTQDAAGGVVMSVQNDARYAPYMQAVQNTDPEKLVAWYVQSYPLFQQAYRQLGYSRGYFNDRLLVAIDNLLAAPDLEQRPPLVLSNGYYRYADPNLESLSSGQRAMLRTGPDNEAKLKARLREIRSRLVGQPLQQGIAPGTAGSAG